MDSILSGSTQEFQHQAAAYLCYTRNFCPNGTEKHLPEERCCGNSIQHFHLLSFATLVFYRDHKSPNQLSRRSKGGILPGYVEGTQKYLVLGISGLLSTKHSIGQFKNSSTVRVWKPDINSIIITTLDPLPPAYADTTGRQIHKESARSDTNPQSFITTQNSLVFPNENSTILETALTRLETIQIDRYRHGGQE